MESHPSVTDRPVRIPPIVWFLGLSLIAALAATFIFNVAISTVVNYGSHGGYQHNTERSESNENGHAGRSGSCH